MSAPDAYLCSFPKSGRTWLRFALASYIVDALRLDRPVDFGSLFAVLPNDEDHPERGRPAFAYGDDPRVPLVLSSHDPYDDRFAGARIVFLVRNVHDVLVSYFFHETRQWHLFEGDLSAYVRDDAHGVPRLARYLNSWSARLPEHDALVLSYERLTVDTAGCLAEAVDHLGIGPAVASSVEAAVAASTFDRMQEAEERAPLAGHAYDVADPDARRVRRGAIGGHHDVMSPADVAWVRDACREQFEPSTVALLAAHGVAP